MLTRAKTKRSHGVLVPSHMATSLVVNAERLEFGACWAESKGHRYFCQIHFSGRVLKGHIDGDVELVTTWRKRQIDQPSVQLEWSPDGIIVTHVQLKGQWYDFNPVEG